MSDHHPDDTSITLYDKEENGTRSSLDAYRLSDGRLCIQGQDLGKAPKEYWGSNEYEYFFAFDSSNETRLVEALAVALHAAGMEATGDTFNDLKTAFSHDVLRLSKLGVSYVEKFLDHFGIEYGFWSRHGD